jgi:hypothetical protein
LQPFIIKIAAKHKQITSLEKMGRKENLAQQLREYFASTAHINISERAKLKVVQSAPPSPTSLQLPASGKKRN